MTLKEIITARRDRSKNKRYLRLHLLADELFQLKEHDKELWLTYDNVLICPTNKFSADPINVLQELRELYIQRKLIQQ